MQKKIRSKVSQLHIDRTRKFLVLLDIYFEGIKGKIVHPRIKDWQNILIEVVYAYFYSIIDDRKGSINVFRAWKQEYPSHMAEIERVESLIEPYKKYFLLFRSNIGFHGSIKEKGVKKGEKIFEEVEGKTTLELMLAVRNLSTHLLSYNKLDKSKVPPYIGCIACKA